MREIATRIVEALRASENRSRLHTRNSRRRDTKLRTFSSPPRINQDFRYMPSKERREQKQNSYS
ncbi:unnamed protein product, partial [Musa textilis]